MIVLTRQGKEKVRLYLDGLKEKRKEILDARKDTADDTELPDEEAISSDIEWSEEEGEYWNCWGVTDHYDADLPLCLNKGTDYIEAE